ncbi:MAG TPA: hypothetical protein VKY56_02020, partial [Chloroflexota bacterium]|nr:hypothetical protein [Chloroflexota bacterium]
SSGPGDDSADQSDVFPGECAPPRGGSDLKGDPYLTESIAVDTPVSQGRRIVLFASRCWSGYAVAAGTVPEMMALEAVSVRRA